MTVLMAALGATTVSLSAHAQTTTCTPPTPGPAFASSQTQNIANRMLVSGSVNPVNSTLNLMQGLQQTMITTGISTPTVVPPTAAVPCPSPAVQNIFTPTAIPSGTQALVTVWGTASAFNSATVYAQAPRSTTVSTSPVAVSSTPPSGYASSITAPSIPSGYVGGYFLLAPADQSSKTGQYQALTYTATQPGDIFFRVDYQTVGPQGDKHQATLGGSTAFRPLLSFASAPTTVNVGACSGMLTVQTTDGNGSPVDVMPGNTPAMGNATNEAQIALSGTPATIFMDPNCLYPTSALGIQNPVPAAPSGKPATITSTRQAIFYYLTDVAQPFPITAAYVDGSGTNSIIYTVVQTQTADATMPVALVMTGPSSVNQNACSAALTATLEDQFGNVAPAQGAAKSLSLAGTAGSTFYSDSACNSAITSLNFASGQSTITYYTKSSVGGLLTISTEDPSSSVASASFSLHVLSTGTLAAGASTPAQATSMARALYLRIVGTPPAMNDPVLAQMSSLLLQGQVLQAAHLASNVDGFYNVTLRNVATSLSNLLFDPLVPLNDFTTTWIGTVRDNLDARQLMTGNTIYVPSSFATTNSQACAPSENFIYDNNHNKISLGGTFSVYSNATPLTVMDQNFVNLRRDLVPVQNCGYNSTDATAPPTALPDNAGLITSRAFMAAHGFAGTNRRLIRRIFQVFMCKDITDVADNQMPDWHIRRDVDRAPGGLPATYTATCRSCHGGMDALDGAFAYFDSYVPANDNNTPAQGDYSVADQRTFYVSKAGIYTSDPCSGTSAANPKTNKNCTVFPAGYVTADDSWHNFFIANQNTSLGWDPNTPLNGNGANALATMFANSTQFASCMSQRAFTAMCKRAPASTDAASLTDLQQDFQASGYNMRRLFERAASLSACLSSGGN